MIQLKKLSYNRRSREAKYDFVCPTHNGSPISKQHIRDFIALDGEILAGIQKNVNANIYLSHGGADEILDQKG